MSSRPLPPFSGALAAALESALHAARAAWPSVALDDDDFASYVRERAPPGDEARYLASLHAGDLYLAAACAKGDPVALASLERSFFADVPAMVERTGASRALGDDAAQILRERLLMPRQDRPPGIADYTGRGALRGWLRVAAVRLAVSLRRGDRAITSEDEALEAPGIDPELALIQARYGDAFRLAFAAALAALPPSERAMLRLHFVDGLNLDRLAAVLRVSRATTGRRILAARKRLLDETLRELGERLRATPTEIESLLAVVRSKLDVSLGALVATAG